MCLNGEGFNPSIAGSTQAEQRAEPSKGSSGFADGRHQRMWVNPVEGLCDIILLCFCLILEIYCLKVEKSDKGIYI